MARYKLSGAPCGGVIDTQARTSIPALSDGPEQRLYQEWLAAGNTPDPVDTPPLILSDERRFSSQVRTTDATPTELVRTTLPRTSVYSVELHLLAVDNAAGGPTRVVRGYTAFKRLNAGAVQVGAFAPVINVADAAAPAMPTLSVVGNDVVITVTGQAGRTIDWCLLGSFVRFGPGGLS